MPAGWQVLVGVDDQLLAAEAAAQLCLRHEAVLDLLAKLLFRTSEQEHRETEEGEPVTLWVASPSSWQERGAAAGASLWAAVLTEMYLCNVCS
jgi:hypothetical protein